MPSERFAALGSTRHFPRSHPAADAVPISTAAPPASTSRVTASVAAASRAVDPFHVVSQLPQLGRAQRPQVRLREMVEARVDLTERDQREVLTDSAPIL